MVSRVSYNLENLELSGKLKMRLENLEISGNLRKTHENQGKLPWNKFNSKISHFLAVNGVIIVVLLESYCKV